MEAQARGQAIRRVRGRAPGILFATVLATLIGWSPWVGQQPVMAAGPIQVQAATRYTLDPGAGRVHVQIQYRVTNNKPNTPTVIYYYRDLSFGIQPDARQIRATDGSGGLGVSTRKRDGFTEVSVRLRANLYYRRTTAFTLRYDLVGAPPRAESPIRVGQAFSTFGVWAFGDPGRGTVEVRIPAGYTTTVEGDSMSSSLDTGQTFRAEPDVPDEFFAIMTSEARNKYEQERLTIDGDIRIVVLSWPEDDDWAETVAETLTDGLPTLHASVGLDWPVEHDLTVRERYTPALEGYAGVFFLDDRRIDISEDLDPITILHEAAHAWFNDDLFTERWIYEGLAEEYAYRVHGQIAELDYDDPEPPDPEDPGFVLLNAWRYPTVVREDTDATEAYGYGAAAWLLHLIVEEAGPATMREAFRAAAEDHTAYPGAFEPETVGAVDGWRRFLDLTQPIDERDPAHILDAIGEFVLAAGDTAILDRRANARDAYRELLDAGDEWLPPWYVRRTLSEWKFADAMTRIDEATALLALRDQVEVAAAAEGLELGDRLERAYESAHDGLDNATAVANDQLAGITAIAAARGKLAAEPDLVTQLGLLNETPQLSYDAARAAFDAGDFDGALAQANAAIAILDRAPGLGQERLLIGVAVATAVLLLLMVLVFIVLRHRRRAAVVAAAGGATLATLDARFAPAPAPPPLAAPAAAPAPAPPPPDPPPAAPPAPLGSSVAADPAATLGAVPDGPPPPIGGAPSDAEGGTAPQ